MANTCKYYKQQKQVSYNQGQTWSNLNEYRMGALYESDSEDCGAVIIMYRWINLNPSTDYYCSGTTKYYKQQKQVSYDEGMTWENVSPSEYQWGGIAETQSTDCGYVPPTPTYRWVSCDGEYMCVGTNKYNKVKKQYYEGGSWVDSSPLETKAGDILVQSNSSDCGGSTAPVSTFKLKTSVTGESKEIPCDTGGVITRDEVQDYYYGQYAHWNSISIGECVREIADDALLGFCNSSAIRNIYVYSKIPPLLSPSSCLDCIVTVYPSTKPPILVPSECVDLYKTSPSWSAYASRIQAIPT